MRRSSVRIIVDDHIARLERSEFLQKMPNREGEAAGVSGDSRRLGDHVSIAIEQAASEVFSFTEAGRIGCPYGRRHHLLHRRQEIVAQYFRIEWI
jgi:hypothetical protein